MLEALLTGHVLVTMGPLPNYLLKLAYWSLYCTNMDYITPKLANPRLSVGDARLTPTTLLGYLTRWQLD